MTDCQVGKNERWDGQTDSERQTERKASQKDKLIGGWPIYLAKEVTGRPANRQVERCINWEEREREREKERWTSRHMDMLGMADSMPKAANLCNHEDRMAWHLIINEWEMCAQRGWCSGEKHTNTPWENPSLNRPTDGQVEKERRNSRGAIPRFAFVFLQIFCWWGAKASETSPSLTHTQAGR